MKYARKVEGSWVDVFTIPCEHFTSLEDLERKLGVSGFVEVDDAVKHGDFVSGGSGYEPRPVAEAPVIEVEPVPAPTKAELLAKVQELVDAVNALPSEEEQPE
jgi:hypothetical protein